MKCLFPHVATQGKCHNAHEAGDYSHTPRFTTLCAPFHAGRFDDSREANYVLSTHDMLYPVEQAAYRDVGNAPREPRA